MGASKKELRREKGKLRRAYKKRNAVQLANDPVFDERSRTSLLFLFFLSPWKLSGKSTTMDIRPCTPKTDQAPLIFNNRRLVCRRVSSSLEAMEEKALEN